MSQSNQSTILPPPSSTRLVTIVAHVDHGKTTLADSLIEHNGIISERLAGTMRYLDSMEEEQRRGITIRSSAIGLKHAYKPLKMSQQQPKSNSKSSSSGGDCNQNMVIHLIDSPGHVDFSMEVSSALQMCDGALLIVDVVEGMCARTQSILREAYAQHLVPILILNKIDRLCTDLGLNVNEAYLRLRGIIESVNAAASAMVQSYRAQADDVDDDAPNGDPDTPRNAESSQTSKDEQERIDKENETMEKIWTFDPNCGNVIFATALYGWGFSTPTLARSLFRSKTVKIKLPIMRQYLFGDFKYNSENGKVLKWKQQNADDESNMTMFAEFGLKPLWEIFTGIYTASLSLGLDSELFSGRVGIVSTTTTTDDNSTSDTDAKKDAKKDNIKLQASTPGMVDMVINSIQIGATVPNDAPQTLQGPKTESEMQQILNKTNASSEDATLRALLRRHRPVSGAVLDAVCEHCPSPIESSSGIRKKVFQLVEPEPSPATKDFPSTVDRDDNEEEFKSIQKAVEECEIGNNDTPAVAHVSKFVATDRSHVHDPELIALLEREDENRRNENSEGNKCESSQQSIILGVSRVLSGVIHSQDVEYFCFGPRYRRKIGKKDSIPRKTIRLYLLMGSTYVRVPSVSAGHICAVYGLEELQLKTVTFCDREIGMPLKVFDRGLQPLVKVNVEALSASDTDVLEKGLAKLSLADAAVEVTATSKGERILACLGEIHLEQSILDLENIYCGKEIELRISKPIVEFGETTDWFNNEAVNFEQFHDDDSPPLRQVSIPPYCYEDGIENTKRGRSRAIISGRCAAVSVRVVPLSKLVFESLKQKTLVDGSGKDIIELGIALNIIKEGSDDTLEFVLSQLLKSLCSIDNNGNAMIESSGVVNMDCIKGVASSNDEIFVPQTAVPTEGDVENENESNGKREYDEIQGCIRGSFRMKDDPKVENAEEEESVDASACRIWKSDMRGSAVAGFRSGCVAGPVCEEPVRGILVVLEGVEIAVKRRTIDKGEQNGFAVAKPISSGMIVAALRTGIRSALLSRPLRLVEGHLRLTLHSSLTGLGPLYAILSKRRGKVLSDTMVEGTDLLNIAATLPQIESFGLGPELLKKSSGEVTAPELVFSHWDILEEDPFWIPTSLEEREDYGEIVMNGDSSTGIVNNALKYIRMVRDRKGLLVDSNKIIVAAEKQRTLARKK